MKKILGLFLTIILFLSLVACTNNDQKGDVSFIDHAGRTVVIKEKAERIVSAYYSSTTLCLTLGLKDNLVAIEKKANERELYKEAVPELLALPGVSTKKEINVEETLKYNPDLVILPLSLKDSAKQFENLGITVIVVNPETQATIKEAINFIALACGKETEAETFNTFNETLIGEIKAKTAELAEADKPSVYISSTSSYLATFPGSYFQNESIALAGGISVSKDLSSEGADQVNKEQLLSWDPDYFFYVADAAYTKDDILADEQLKGLSALPNNLAMFPSKLENWDANNSSYALGVMWLTAKLHPELYSLNDVFSKAETFYQDFYNLNVTKDMLGL